MKDKREIVALIAAVGIVFSICSCDKKAEGETTEAPTSETTQETTTESTATEETEFIEEEDDFEYDYEKVRIDIDEPLLGFEGCYAEGGNMYFDFFDWTIYNADGKVIGTQFGFGNTEPLYYVKDYDGDGNEELICPVQYGADMAIRVLVYRNNNGTIEEGDVDERKLSNRIGEGLCVQNHNVFYDPENEVIFFEYYDGLNNESLPLKLDDYYFYPEGSVPDLYEPEFEGWKTETVTLSNEPLLGFENWYSERRYDGYGYSYWDFYSEDGVLFAKQFGVACEERPLIHILDLDGDGNDELVSECYYNDSGETHIFIYKNNNGVIECGYLDPVDVRDVVESDADLTTWDYYEDYDKKNDRIVVYYFEDDMFHEVIADDFTFEEGDPTVYFSS